jgi:hypothetical protein|tara:strand:- start:328 stop:594 length:267 start_codon:yes stop_codon:yes gene_type:complete
MIQLEVTVKDKVKIYTDVNKDLNKCIKKFFKENEQSVNEITAIHLFESEDPTQFMKLGGNQGCVDWLKAMLQGLPPNNNNNKKGDSNE